MRLIQQSIAIIYIRGPTRPPFCRPGRPATGFSFYSLPAPVKCLYRPGLPGEACLFVYINKIVVKGLKRVINKQKQK